jgi:hypothetical protein
MWTCCLYCLAWRCGSLFLHNVCIVSTRWHVMASYQMARHGIIPDGTSWHHTRWHVMASYQVACHGIIPGGMSWHHTRWHVMASYQMAHHGIIPDGMSWHHTPKDTVIHLRSEVLTMVLLKIQVFWLRCWSSWTAWPWRWRHYSSLNYWEPVSQWHITSQKIQTFSILHIISFLTFIFCWPHILKYVCNETNLMCYLASVYWVTIPLCV